MPKLALLGLAALTASCAPAARTDAVAPAARSPQATGAPIDPVAVFLTWQRDPATTMTVDWHTEGEVPDAVLQFRRQGERRWQSRAPRSFPFPHTDRTIHRVELTGLRPDATYEFRMGEAWRTFTFRTMPRRANRPIRFVAGGDVRHDQEWMEATGRQAAAYDPDFIMWGGDLAYADGLPERANRWFEFFDAIKNTLLTPEGRVIPVLAAIGNHEVAGSYHFRIENYRQDDETRARIASFYYALFATPGQPGYGVLDFGNYLSIVLLDTDHTNPIAGEQTAWLERVLRERQRVPHVFPIYHVPAYPSVRVFDGEVSQRVREHWVPLFERYGVRVAFENHDHAYKRTFPLRGGERSPDGIVYLGDGAWGVGVREIGRDWPDGQRPPYLERGKSVRHFILGEIRGDQRRFIMVDEEGAVFDEFPAGSRAAIGAPRFGAPAPLPSAASADPLPTLPFVGEDTLRAVVVTERVFDDSDDPAIWIHPEDPARSLVLGTDKHDTNGGVYVFGLDGRIDRQRSRTGMRRVNNVDVAQGVRLGGRTVDIAVATERNAMALRVFSLPDMRPIDGGGIPVFAGDTLRAPMGVALYTRPRDGAVFAIVGGKDGPRDGYLWQYRLEADGSGRVRGTRVREFGRYSGLKEIEAIAVDSELGYVYYADEMAGIRKYHADPDAGNEELALFGTSNFVRDHEGIAIYRRDNGMGCILVSDQQGRRLQVFPRQGWAGNPHDHPTLAIIPVSANETDGIEVTAMPLGPAFPHGLLVMMSDDGTFHFFRWEDVEARIPTPLRCGGEGMIG